MEIRTIGVVGAGQMGHGIAQVAAERGYAVVLADLDDALVAKGLAAIERNLERAVGKGKLAPEAKRETVGRVRGTAKLEELGDCDLVVEAVIERFEVKAELFRALDRTVKAGRILASNTSSISITRLAAVTERPPCVIGMHFMNPVPVMQLVEVIRGLATSDETARSVIDLAKALGKTPIECRDSPGFVSNRVLMPMINEAIFAVHEGVATPEAVDGIMKLGMNHPMGPLALADFIGLDTCLAILEVLYEGFGDPKYRPCPLLRRHVEAGWLGRKTGRGFYTYPA